VRPDVNDSAIVGDALRSGQMCGRFTLATPNWDMIRAVFDALPDDEPFEWTPRYNIAPTDSHPVARVVGGQRRLTRARWGLPGRDKQLINARGETLAERPRFRDLLNGGRCVVPADGFFEWQEGQPWWYSAPDGGPLFFAGLWEDGPDAPRFLIVTTAANDVVAPVHDRMPALLTPACIGEWLKRPALELLVPAPESALVARPVSSRVSSVANDDASLLEPVKARGQLKLF
jgi:putative SOS response-associated peptidase YedK